MNLKTYLSSRRGRAAHLAKAIGVSPVTIHNWAYDAGKQVPAERCPEIEKIASGLVTCEELRPDVDWGYLRRSGRQESPVPS
ncbi:transcriptional regulator [Verminephrobacter aporrectodeae subsp. tuberculatae]|uniref:Transcriptional regulator n=2 Tax=Verminephrobacter TaxID=364316 RepID=A0ABT3L0L0_9BURK|nr:transcriptional regulator [Verminephrobacter aporrectodeae subsp. tuberculatae]